MIREILIAITDAVLLLVLLFLIVIIRAAKGVR